MHGDPGLWHALLDRLAVDRRRSSCGCRSRRGSPRSSCSTRGPARSSLADYEQFVLPHSRAVLEPLAGTVPRIHFGVGTGELLAAMRHGGRRRRRRRLAGAAGRGGPPARARRRWCRATSTRPCCCAEWPVIEREVRRSCDQGRAAAGHIFNLGHGVPPTPIRTCSPGSSSWSSRSDDPVTRCRRRRRDLRARRRLVRCRTARPTLDVTRARGVAGRSAASCGSRRSAGAGRRRRRGAAGPAARGVSTCSRCRPRRLSVICAADDRGAGPRRRAPRIRCRPGRCSASRPTSSALRASGVAQPGRRSRRSQAEPSPPPLDPPLTGDVAVGGWSAIPAGRRGGRPARRAAARRGLRRAGRRALAAGHDCRRWPSGSASRRVAGRRGARRDRRRAPATPSAGPVFATLRRRARPAAGGARLVRAIRGADRRRPSARMRRTPTGFALECGPVPWPARFEADAVIVAAPAAKAARLLRDVAPAAAAELARIESASMAIVTLAFATLELPPAAGCWSRRGSGSRSRRSRCRRRSGRSSPAGLTLLRASVGRAGETTCCSGTTPS